MSNQPAIANELLHSQILTLEALIRVLEQKGFVKKDEVFAEVQKVNQELAEKKKKN